MMNTFDIVLILLVIFLALLSAKRGLLRSLLNLGVVILSGILSRILANPVVDLLYTGFAHEPIRNKLLSLLPEGSVSGQIDSVLAQLPEPVIAIAKQFGLYPQLNNGTQVLSVEAIEMDYIKPVVTGVAVVVVTVILYFILSLILRFVANMINERLTDSDNHKWMHGVNAVMGGVVGLIKGVIPAGILCVAANLLTPVIGNANFTELVNSSYFCHLAANLFH